MEQDAKPETKKDMIDRLFTAAWERRAQTQASSQGVALIAEVVSRIQTGQPVKEMANLLAPILSEQQAKTNILQALMFNHQMERVVLHWDMRWQLERDLWEDLKQQKLTPAEKLTLLSLSCKEAEKAASYVDAHSPNFKPITDIAGILEQTAKPDMEHLRADIRADLIGTTPQGMEAIRRFTAKAKKRAEELVGAALKNEAEEEAQKQPSNLLKNS